MATELLLTRDAAGKNTFGLEFSDTNFSTTLTLAAEQTVTIPGDVPKWGAVFSYEPGSSVWVARNKSALLPGASFATTNSVLNPTVRVVYADDVLHLITGNTDAKVGISLYAIQ